MTLLEKLFELFPVYPPGKLLYPQNQIYHLTDAHPGTIKMLVEMGHELDHLCRRLQNKKSMPFKHNFLRLIQAIIKS